MSQSIDAIALRRIFLDARTHNKWRDEDVPDSLLREIVDVAKLGPTSANCSPARFVFVKSKAEKERLKPHPMSGFDNAGVDRDFFAGTSIRSNFLCNLGYGDASVLKPRSPRLAFEEMAKIV